MTTPIQPDLFASPPPVVLPPDPLAQRIVDRGLVANDYLLRLNQSITKPVQDLPSRLFQFPVEFIDRERRKDGKSALLLRHPDLAAFPFVDEIERESGERPVWEPEDEFGRDRGASWRYYHALDLLTDEHWKDLIATENFTDQEAIVIGLAFRRDYGGLSNANTRTMLAHIGSEEPSDKSAGYLAANVSSVQMLQGEYVKFGTRDESSIWAGVHGLENKTFKRDRNGHLRFSKPSSKPNRT